MRISLAGFGVAVLGSLALGYAFRLWVGEWKPAPRLVPDAPTPDEWTPGEYAGYPNAYHVRPLE